MQSGLPVVTLGQIWFASRRKKKRKKEKEKEKEERMKNSDNFFSFFFFFSKRELADYNKDGMLDLEEFTLAMFLVEKAKLGSQLPKILPTSLIPPSKRAAAFGVSSPPVSSAPRPTMAPLGMGANSMSGINLMASMSGYPMGGSQAVGQPYNSVASMQSPPSTATSQVLFYNDFFFLLFFSFLFFSSTLSISHNKKLLK